MRSLVVGIADCQVSRDPEVAGHLRAGFVHRGGDPRPGGRWAGCCTTCCRNRRIDRPRRSESVHVRRYRHSAAVRGRAGTRRAKSGRMMVRLAGGAQVMDQQGVFNIGKRNYLAARKILWKAGVLIRPRRWAATSRARCVWKWAADGSGCGKAAEMRAGDASEAPRPPRKWKGSLNGLSVLIVDDSPAMRGFIRRVIAFGHRSGRMLGGGQRRRSAGAAEGAGGGRHPHRHQHAGDERRRTAAPLEEHGILRSVPVLVISTDATKGRIRACCRWAPRIHDQALFPGALREELERVLGARDA